MNIKNKKLRNLTYIAMLIPLFIGFVLYFASKIIRGLAYLLMFKKQSAKDEIRYFWMITTSF
jgi:hypothetical protein|tara:strand:- start:190 stop:375 length:186 start_codon:yes stop_codon:yes gene_type:complete